MYAAWIDPVGLRGWMCPGDVLSAEATLDVRVGGSFRITMRSKERVHEHVGTYQIVDPPAKLRFTWSGLDNLIRRGNRHVPQEPAHLALGFECQGKP